MPLDETEKRTLEEILRWQGYAKGQVDRDNRFFKFMIKTVIVVCLALTITYLIFNS